MTTTLNIAVLAGDGIGPEITREAVAVLRRLEAQGHFGLNLGSAEVGGAGYRASGHPLPEATLRLAQQSQAILFGAVGDFSLDNLPRELRPEQAILGLRKSLGLFANLRPAIIFPELASASTLKPEVVSGMDLLILRELTGDIYFGQPRGVRILENGEREGFDTMVYRESEIVRIGRVAFEAARKRGRRLCSVDKANVLETTQLWRDV
ncbi:MAG: isocitrate/isopropylmalate family dehydrogenase, partial [Burkholderiaceae bacterium]